MTSKRGRTADGFARRLEWLERQMSTAEIQERLRGARVGLHDKTLLRQILQERGVEPEG